MRSRVIAGILTLLVLIVGVGAWQHNQRTPQYALKQAIRAVERGDRVTFERYVDVDRTVESIVDALIEAEKANWREVSEMDTSLDAQFAAAGRRRAEAWRPELTEEVHTQLLEAVNAGNLNPLLGSENLLSDPHRVADLRFGGFSAVTKVGNRASVALNLRFEALDTTLTATLHLARTDKGPWRLVGVQDVAGLVADIAKIEEQRLVEVNLPIEQEIASFVSLGDYNATIVGPGWARRLSVDVPVTNVSNVQVRNVRVAVVKTFEADSYQKMDFPVLESLAPGSNGSVTGEVRESHRSGFFQLINQERTDLFKINIQAVDIEKNGGWTTLAPYPSWIDYLKSLDTLNV